MKDEVDYVKEDREDLLARLMGAQSLAQFLLKAYSALQSYGVDFKKLPEWKDQQELEDARRLKPHASQGKIIGYFERLESGLRASIRRAQMKLHIGGKKDTKDDA